MTTCNLTKLETALEQVKKSRPKLKPTDAALVAAALSVAGRHALAIYEGEQFAWPHDYEKLTNAMSTQIAHINESVETVPVKRGTKVVEAEEPIEVTIGLTPNLTAGEEMIPEERDDLKTVLSDLIQDGVEFAYIGSDIGWQWAFDRAKWDTIVGQDLHRKIRVRAQFTQGAVGIELGLASTKKRARAKPAASVETPIEVPDADDNADAGAAEE